MSDVTSIEQLTARVNGVVLTPTDPGYDEERTGFQQARRHRPDVVVGAVDADDVRAAVTYAAERGLGVAVQGTGHGLAVPASDGVLVSTRRLTGVRVDAAARTARVEAGVPWGAVMDAAAEHGLAPLSGSAPHVGAVSSTLGGGVGLLARRYGFAADHVRAVEVVTADGRLRRATPDRETELFWGIRGGRGLGVVTAVEIDLMPVATLYGGGLFVDGEHAEAVWQAYAEWTATVPEEMTSSIALVRFPDRPGVPEAFRGRHVSHVRIAYAGDTAAGERWVAPLRAAVPVLRDTVGELPYARSGSIHDEPPHPAAYHSDHVLLGELAPGAVKAVLDEVGPGAPESCIVEVRHLGGALSRPPAVPNAVGNRDARYSLTVLSLTADGASVRPLHDRVLGRFAPWATGGRLLTFLDGDNATAANVRAAFDPADWHRLLALKNAVDPTDVFRHGHPLRR